MEEIWKDIEGYEGLYQVSNLGQVRSLNYNHTGKTLLLKPRKDWGGYLYVHLCKNGKSKFIKVHRLVAKAFIENPLNFKEVNHRDENKENNCVDNLEFCDRKYNCNFGTRNKRLSETLKNRKDLSKKVICKDLINDKTYIFPSSQECDRYFNMPLGTTCKRIFDNNGNIKKYNLYVEYIENEEGI